MNDSQSVMRIREDVARIYRDPPRGGAEIPLTVGSIPDMPGSGTYRLIYVARNLLFDLLTQDDQVLCFDAVAGRLAEDGSFVVGDYMPGFYQLCDDRHVGAEAVLVEEGRTNVRRNDPAAQAIEEIRVSLSPSGVHPNPDVQRDAWPWPCEIDLMVRLVGPLLENRRGGLNKRPFDSASGMHVSTFGR